MFSNREPPEEILWEPIEAQWHALDRAQQMRCRAMRNCAPSPACRELPKPLIASCNFGAGCCIAYELLPDNARLAQTVLSRSCHLADALFQLRIKAYGKPSIDMALAVQEARADPPRHSPC